MRRMKHMRLQRPQDGRLVHRGGPARTIGCVLRLRSRHQGALSRSTASLRMANWAHSGLWLAGAAMTSVLTASMTVAALAMSDTHAAVLVAPPLWCHVEVGQMLHANHPGQHTSQLKEAVGAQRRASVGTPRRRIEIGGAGEASSQFCCLPHPTHWSAGGERCRSVPRRPLLAASRRSCGGHRARPVQ